MSEQPLIAVRVKDGIFVGNVTAAHDEDFLVMNKCTHVINCAGAEVRDLYQHSGIQYLTFMWKDTNASTCTTVMFDSADRNVESAVRFIDKALEAGECVLIHSYFGVSRSAALCVAYLMMKYGWNCDNALHFVAMAHQDMNIKPYFMRQLRTFSKRHEVDVDVFDTRVDESHFSLDNEQWALRNTFVNGLVADVQETHELYRAASNQIKILDANFKNAARRRRRITFSDTKQGTSVQSDQTQPLLLPERVHHHVDPVTGASFVASRTAPGATPPQAVLARRGTPNKHRLEGEHAKSRQVLVLRPEFQPSQPSVTTTTNHWSLPPPSEPTANNNSNSSAPSAATQQAAPSSVSGYGAAAPPSARSSFYGAGTGPREDYYASQQSTTFTLRSYGDATDGGELPRRVVPDINDNSNSTANRASTPSTTVPSSVAPQPARSATAPPTSSVAQRSTGTKIASPFTLSSAAGPARRGSPLPKRQLGGAATGSPVPATSLASATGGGITRGRTLTHPAVGLAASSSGGSRTNSPLANASSSSSALRRPVRANSPQAQPSSPTQQPRASSPFGGNSSSLYGREPATQPRPNLSNGGASVLGTGLAGSGSGVRGTPTTHYVFQQQSTSSNGGSSSSYGAPVANIPNASSTVQRYPVTAPASNSNTPYGQSNVRGAPYSAVPTTLLAGSGAARTGSPLARRASSPMSSGPVVSATAPRTGSPVARPASVSGFSSAPSSSGPGRNSPQRLAEQYLSGAASASAYGRDTNASLLRRNSSAQRR